MDQSQYVQNTINNHPLHPPKSVTGMMASNNQVCRVDMSQSAKNIHNFIRGLDSSPGAFKRSSTSSPKHPYHHHHKQNQLHPRPRFLSRCLQTAPTSTLKPFWQNILTIIITSINILITNNIYHTQVPGQTSTGSQPSFSTVVSGMGSLNQVNQIWKLVSISFANT